MRHAFWTTALVALVLALVALFYQQYSQFAIFTALFLVATLIDLRVHRRGRYRDRSAVLLFAAIPAIVVAGVFSAPAAYATATPLLQNGIQE